MGRKNRRKEGGWHNASGKPSALVLPTDAFVLMRGVRCRVWRGTLPSGALLMLAAPVAMPLADRRHDASGLLDELAGMERKGFPDALVDLLQQAVATVGLEAAESADVGDIDTERVMTDLVRILGIQTPEDRARSLAELASACGFTAGDAFAFLAALPEEREACGHG